VTVTSSVWARADVAGTRTSRAPTIATVSNRAHVLLRPLESRMAFTVPGIYGEIRLDRAIDVHIG
jgi:hypothetical protein